MSSISFVLNLARGALYATQQGMAVTAHNIANVNTPGYTRQKLNFQNVGLDNPGTRLQFGYGVVGDSVFQYYDRFLTKSLHQKTSQLGETEAESSALQKMESLFNDGDGTGLSQPLQEFWKAWQDVANNPEGLAERSTLLQKGESLAERFHTLREDLTRIQADSRLSLGGALKDLNQFSAQVAELNRQIVASEAGGTRANDLRDQRQVLLGKMSELLGNTQLENPDGSVTVITSNGLLLVDQAQAFTLSLEGSEIRWEDLPRDLSPELRGGKIGGILDLRDDVLPQVLANLDELAGNLIQQVNQLHAGGYGLDGVSGRTFFDTTGFNPADFHGAAGYIRLSPDVKNTPKNIAAASALADPGPPPVPQPGDNENALAILGLQNAAIAGFRKWTYSQRGGPWPRARKP